MELYLIRHAQSQNNALPEEQRVEDPGLTELGNQQADCSRRARGIVRSLRISLEDMDLAREDLRQLLDVLLRAVRLTPVDGDDDLGATGFSCPRRVLDTHRVVPPAGQERDVATYSEHRRQKIGVPCVIIGGVPDGEDVAEPAVLRRMEFLLGVVRGHCENVEAVELEQVTRSHEMVRVREQFLHRRGGDDHRVRVSDAGDVVLGEVVVVRMGEEDQIGPGVLVHPQRIHVYLHAPSSDSDGGASEPGDAIE